jgi:hypothetical protein
VLRHLYPKNDQTKTLAKSCQVGNLVEHAVLVLCHSAQMMPQREGQLVAVAAKLAMTGLKSGLSIVQKSRSSRRPVTLCDGVPSVLSSIGFQCLLHWTRQRHVICAVHRSGLPQ